VVGALLAARALVPIERITARARSIAAGNVDGRLDPPGAPDEIGRMTTLLNDMLDRLHAIIDANRRFAADASHELRSPLTAMAGEVDVTLRRERTPEEYRETLTTLRERLTDLTRLTEDLMVVVRAEERPGDTVMQEVRLGPVVAASLARLAPVAAARGVALETDRVGDLIAYGDPSLYARVVDNLAGNAVQYNREGGRVTITGCYDPPAGDTWQTGYVRLLVEDTGSGIPEAEWERVFERFYRRDQSRSRRTGGTGLGLALCRAIATLCGGTVRVATSSERGTTFELRLPGRRAAVRPTEAVPAPQ
jgi:two-component system OmpR family sensor kinase